MGLGRKEPRIEPTFGDSREKRGSDGFRVSADDRAVQPGATRKDRSERKAPRKPARGGGGGGNGRKTRRRRSPLARLANLVFMLGLFLIHI